MRIGILCRSTEHFRATIEYLIANKCLDRDSLVKNGRYEVRTYTATYTPIYLGREDYRGHRFDLIIPEVSMPKIVELQQFQQSETIRLSSIRSEIQP